MGWNNLEYSHKIQFIVEVDLIIHLKGWRQKVIALANLLKAIGGVEYSRHDPKLCSELSQLACDVKLGNEWCIGIRKKNKNLKPRKLAILLLQSQ